MKYRILIFSILISCFSFNCTSEQNQGTKGNTTNSYFDVTGFFKEEIKKLEDRKIEKTVILNSLNQTLLLDSIDFEIEFAPFLSSSISQSALTGKYTVDTTIQSNISLINYTAKEEELKVQSIKITKSPNGIEQIDILKKSESLIYSSDQELTYNSNKGYSIVSKQKVFLFEPTASQIHSTFK